MKSEAKKIVNINASDIVKHNKSQINGEVKKKLEFSKD